MEKLVNLSFKVPESTHKKLKVISALSGKAMSDIIVDFIEKQKLTIPGFGDKPAKRQKTKTLKPVTRKDMNPDFDKEKVMVEILKHKADGLSLREIANALTDAGFAPPRADGWNKQTIGRWTKKQTAE